MPPPLSAGILLYRRRAREPEVLLVKPGGPFWRNKDVGAWMIPKGMVEAGETPAEAALREFEEEVGVRLTDSLSPLCRVRQAGGKPVEAFAVEGDLDVEAITSIQFEIEWPPKTGERRSFPEVEQARWMTLPEARRLMLESQRPMLDALEAKLRPGVSRER
ncbi:MAG TPA: NUDIX domain-containing protein [Sphingomicrobium sp.]|nr:NUDIX domain-containing protein [Sphingomicrobium sp.]